MTYYRIKARVEEKKLQRLHEIAKIGFVDPYLERIDQLELIQREMRKNYGQEQCPYKRVIILEKIAAVQPYLSARYEATKEVMTQDSMVNNNYFAEGEGEAVAKNHDPD
jgi:hypothetical protein